MLRSLGDVAGQSEDGESKGCDTKFDHDVYVLKLRHGVEELMKCVLCFLDAVREAPVKTKLIEQFSCMLYNILL